MGGILLFFFFLASFQVRTVSVKEGSLVYLPCDFGGFWGYLLIQDLKITYIPTDPVFFASHRVDMFDRDPTQRVEVLLP